MRGEHGFRVILAPSAGSERWPDAHHHVAVGGRALELVRQLRVGDQRVVAAGEQRVRETLVHRGAVVCHVGVLAVDRLAADGASPKASTIAWWPRHAPASEPRLREGP